MPHRGRTYPWASVASIGLCLAEEYPTPPLSSIILILARLFPEDILPGIAQGLNFEGEGCDSTLGGYECYSFLVNQT